jgi:nitrogen-specific signal transduction histidine kinase
VRLFTKESWSYAVLMVILFAIAAIAVGQAISFLHTRVADQDIGIVTAMLWSITMGFMLIAGAFGLWSIQFAAGAESRRRISAIVDSMDYLQDGLVAVDSRDHAIGCNPAAREMLHGQPCRKRALAELFPSLQPGDLELLLHDNIPQEVERSHIDEGLTHTLRFRSQPTRGVTLVLVSDVTAAQARRQHRQQSAKLQLVGQLARAVANDFNNLLCGIAGHAALLPRLPPGAPELAESVASITDSAERGIALAGHLMELSRPSSGVIPARMVGDHVTSVAGALRDSLPTGWSVETEVQDMPATSLTGMQIEQVILNLAQIISENSGKADIISIIAGPPGSHPLLSISERFAGGIVVARAGTGSTELQSEAPVSSEEAGLILSVIRSLLEGVGGELHHLTGSDGHPMYRIALPVAAAVDTTSEQVELPFDIDRYVTHWNILVAGRKHRHLNLVQRLKKLEAKVTLVDTIADILAATGKEDRLDAVVLDWPLLGTHEEGTLKALVKLSPASGIVVLRDAKPRIGRHELPGVVCIEEHANPDRILMAMVEARSLAAARSRDAK